MEARGQRADEKGGRADLRCGWGGSDQERAGMWGRPEDRRLERALDMGLALARRAEVV